MKTGARMKKMKLGGYTRWKGNANSRGRRESGGLQHNKINKKGKGDPGEKQNQICQDKGNNQGGAMWNGGSRSCVETRSGHSAQQSSGMRNGSQTAWTEGREGCRAEWEWSRRHTNKEEEESNEMIKEEVVIDAATRWVGNQI